MGDYSPTYQNQPPPSSRPRKPATQPPQRVISEYWHNFKTPYPGKVFTVLPPQGPRKSSSSLRSGAGKRCRIQRPPKTYEQARAECMRDVDRIIHECQRTNQKYRDPHFDIEWDLKSRCLADRDCLDGLRNKFDNVQQPKGVKRVTDIFEDPHFYINGPTAGDVRQGRDGDCYLMAALCGLGSMEGLIERVTVKYDQDVGVYGFVFHRDGEWQQTIVDDKLYLRAPDYEEALEERDVWEQIDRLNAEEEYRKAHQTGSRALYFAQCSHENETWLPLLEKAYAKAHGDYAAIDGGWVGEAVEDLTGGVTTEIYSSDILDKDKFWADELMKVGKDFLFGCATGFYSDWLAEVDRAKNPNNQNAGLRNTDRRGVVENHAYSIMEAREVRGQRLLKVRNPWGKKEWTGKWSDGSEQWDPEWMRLLDHKFGNDGIFWISYEDLLKRYQHFDRTRIFTDDWTVKQSWVSVDVGWEPDYHQTKFQLELKEQAKVVIVLSQLDSNYWQGLEGEYNFDLQFRLEDADSRAGEYIVRSHGRYAMERSVSTDLELPAGKYYVFMKIEATHNDLEPVESLLPGYVKHRRDKLIEIGTSYDLAHEKGVYIQSKEEKYERLKRQKEKKKQEREEAREALKKKQKKIAFKQWEKTKKEHMRQKKRDKKREQIEKARAEKTGVTVVAHGHRPMVPGLEGPQANESPLEAAQPNDQSALAGLPAQGPSGTGISSEARSGELKGLLGTQAQDREGPASANSDGPNDNKLPQIKSFSGEDVPTPGTASPTETLPGAPPPTRVMTKESSPILDGSDVLQPLEKILEGLPSEAVSECGDKPPTPVVQINGEDAITDVKPMPTQPQVSEEEHQQASQASKGAIAELNRLPTPPPEPSNSKSKSQQALEAQDKVSKVETNDRSKTKGDSRIGTGSAIIDGDEPTGLQSDEDDAASVDSFGSFDWDSELDMPSETSSSSENSEAEDENADSSDSESEGERTMYRPPSPIKPFTPRSKRKAKIRYGWGRGLGDQTPGSRRVEASSEDEAGPKGEQLWNAVCTVGLRVYSTLADEKVGLRVVWPEHEEEERLASKRRGSWRKKHKAKGRGEEGKVVDPDDMNRGAVVLKGGAPGGEHDLSRRSATTLKARKVCG